MNISPDKVLSQHHPYERKRFAEEISNNILSYLDHETDSLVIGINGAWGSGKSTLLAGIKENLKNSSYYNLPKRNRLWYRLWLGEARENKDQTKLFLLDFNPWIFSGKEQLHSNFLGELSLKIGSAASKLRKKIESFSKRILWIGEYNSYTSTVKQQIDKFAKISVEQLKREVNVILEKNNIKAVVIMDDIDRLAPAEILEVFQLVKLNGNFKNTVFLLAFDKQVVSDAIESQYQFDGEQYLEKIVQVDYSIPVFLPEHIESEFFTRLTTILNEYSIKVENTDLYMDWLHRGLRHYFRNIRDINRYFNSIAFRLPSIHNDVNTHDFLLIEAIRLFDYQSFELIRHHYKESEMYGSDSYHRRALANIPEGATKMIYESLFQRNHTNRGVSYRIHNVEFFDRYFSLSVSTKDVREEEFKQFLFYPDNRINLLKTVIKEDKLDFLLRRIIALTEEEGKQDLSVSIDVMFSVWGEYKDQFITHWRDIWKAIIVMVKTAPDKNAAMKKVINEVSVTPSDFNPARFVFMWLLLEHINRDDSKNIDPLIDEFIELLNGKKEDLEKSWKHTLENSKSHFIFRDSPGNLYQNIFFPSYAKYFQTEYLEQVTHIINQSEQIFKIANLLVFRDSSTGIPMGINAKHLDTLLPKPFRETFMNKLKNFPLATISEQDSLTIQGLLMFLESDNDPFIGKRRV